jgi:hypothetical protein
MFAANFVEYFFCWKSTSVLCVLKSLPDAILCIVAIRNVEQTLEGFGVLHTGIFHILHCMFVRKLLNAVRMAQPSLYTR